MGIQRNKCRPIRKQVRENPRHKRRRQQLLCESIVRCTETYVYTSTSPFTHANAGTLHEKCQQHQHCTSTTHFSTPPTPSYHYYKIYVTTSSHKEAFIPPHSRHTMHTLFRSGCLTWLSCVSFYVSMYICVWFCVLWLVYKPCLSVCVNVVLLQCANSQHRNDTFYM